MDLETIQSLERGILVGKKIESKQDLLYAYDNNQIVLCQVPLLKKGLDIIADLRPKIVLEDLLEIGNSYWNTKLPVSNDPEFKKRHWFITSGNKPNYGKTHFMELLKKEGRVYEWDYKAKFQNYINEQFIWLDAFSGNITLHDL